MNKYIHDIPIAGGPHEWLIEIKLTYPQEQKSRIYIF